MTLDELRNLPAFAAAWPSCRDALMEYLHRKSLTMAAENNQQPGTQTLAKLIVDLEKLDLEPRPIVRPKGLKPLHSMNHNPSEKP